MRILWSSDVAEQIIRRMNDAEQGIGDCLRDARSAARALDEANEDGESRTLSSIANRLEELTRRMQAAQQRIDDLIDQTKSTDERFAQVERQISAMFDGADSVPKPESKPQTVDWSRWVEEMDIMPLLREMSGWYTPDWLNELASDPKNFFIM